MFCLVQDPDRLRELRDRAWRLVENGGAEGWLHNVVLLHQRPTTVSAGHRRRRRGADGDEDGAEALEEDEEDEEQEKRHRERTVRVQELRQDVAKKQAALRPLRIAAASWPSSTAATTSRQQHDGNNGRRIVLVAVPCS